MGSDAELDSIIRNIPLIYFSNEKLIPGDSEWESAKLKVVQALEEYGCFEARFRKINPGEVLIEELVFDETEKLFALPLEIKELNVSNKPYRGYIGNSPYVPLYESIGFEDANVFQEVEKSTNKFWPAGNPSFSKTIHDFSEKVAEFDQTIMKMILESFGLEKYFDEHLNSTNYLLRIMKYEAPKNKEAKEIGLTPHTDKNFLTILRQNQIEGLEVQTKDGQWIQVNPSPDSYIVFAGDALHAKLNGRIHSVCHRVVMSGNAASLRYSIALFSTPNPGCILNPAEEVVDEEHPLLFKPFRHEEYIDFVFKNEGWRHESPLKVFCGM
jgi:isopenicillin N synthase-like dioxygenase